MGTTTAVHHTSVSTNIGFWPAIGDVVRAGTHEPGGGCMSADACNILQTPPKGLDDEVLDAEIVSGDANNPMCSQTKLPQSAWLHDDVRFL